MSADLTSHFARGLAPFIEKLFQRAAAPPEWNLTMVDFRRALERSARHCYPDSPPGVEDLKRYLGSLHISDLALACACRAGNEAAWEYFVAQFRPELCRTARAIAGESRGRELADSLYAELYGLETREGERRSLFEYFYGRSKLGTWLRAILAQRNVDEWRRTRRTEPLTEDDAAEGRLQSPRDSGTNGPPDPQRARYLAMLQTAVTDALAGLDPRDRLRLAYYYVEALTLAEIGRLLGEHEATVSRKLDRARAALRQQVDQALRDNKRLSEAQVRLCYEYAQEEWPFDLTRALSVRE